jgi:2'-hydroxyisoflavone reductase
MGDTLLILGGTSFLGRALTARAIELGFAVTLFNRGQTNPELFPEAEHLKGDRTNDLSALEGRRWDLAIDVAAYDPQVVVNAVNALAGSIGHYAFISTVGVYATYASPEATVEGSPVLDVAEVADNPGLLYGANKAKSEGIVIEAMRAENTLLVRPGLIVGEHDPTDRFGYWPRRMSEGGRVLAPGKPEDPQQYVDVKDLADWTLQALRRRLSGVFNVTGRVMPFGDLIEACRVPGVDCEVEWVSTERLIAVGAMPWMSIPQWMDSPETRGIVRINTDRVFADGFNPRPLAETVADARPLWAAAPAFTRADESALFEKLSVAG